MREDSRLREGLQALTIHEALDGMRSGDFSSVELTTALLERIEQLEGSVMAYLNLTPELALERAEEADQLRSHGQERPLLGVPLAIKDVLATAGVQTTCGSRILQGFVPPYTATAVSNLFDAGAVMLGKSNTDEFAMGSSTENSGYFTTHNPWDFDRVPGGSSGGSAAAVIAGEALDAVLVPVQALREMGAGPDGQPQYAVFVVGADGQLQMRVVEVGLKDYVNAEILSGLEAGEVVSTGVETSSSSSTNTDSAPANGGGEFGPPGDGGMMPMFGG